MKCPMRQWPGAMGRRASRGSARAWASTTCTVGPAARAKRPIPFWYTTVCPERRASFPSSTQWWSQPRAPAHVEEPGRRVVDGALVRDSVVEVPVRGAAGAVPAPGPDGAPRPREADQKHRRQHGAARPTRPRERPPGDQGEGADERHREEAAAHEVAPHADRVAEVEEETEPQRSRGAGPPERLHEPGQDDEGRDRAARQQVACVEKALRGEVGRAQAGAELRVGRVRQREAVVHRRESEPGREGKHCRRGRRELRAVGLPEEVSRERRQHHEREVEAVQHGEAAGERQRPARARRFAGPEPGQQKADEEEVGERVLEPWDVE